MASWKLESGAMRLPVMDMHTAGEPVRIVDARGWPVPGDTLLERRQALSTRHDGLRRMLMLEPRGHADMYGAFLLPPAAPGADAGVVFTHVSGYSTMCGHATIALARYLHDERGLAGPSRFLLECPCGPVVAEYEPREGGVGVTTFENVPSFAAGLDLAVTLPGRGRVRFDLAFGGAYYAVVTAAALDLDLRTAPLREVSAAAGELVASLRRLDLVRHPAEPALGFLYGAIVTSGPTLRADGVNDHVCWFGEGQIDRSPTGSGVSARLALAVARGEPVQDREFRFAGVSGQAFAGRVLNGDPRHVVTRISGTAHYTSISTMIAEPSDPFAQGFELPAATPPMGA